MSEDIQTKHILPLTLTCMTLAARIEIHFYVLILLQLLTVV